MAKNIVKYLDAAVALPVVVTHPATPASSDPVRFGVVTGVALTDEGEGGNLSTETSVLFGAFVGRFTVDDDAGTGIAVGDRVYYQDTATGTPATNLNNNATTPEAVFGLALETVGVAATADILVYHPAAAVAL